MSDHPLVASGFARVTREVCRRLGQVPDVELACVGWGYDGWPYQSSEWAFRIYPSAAQSFGRDVFERVVDHYQPDVVIMLGEIWMIEWLARHPTRGRFKWVAYLPLDGGPMYPPWESTLRDMDEVIAMSDFGRRTLQAGVPAKRIHRIHHGVDATVFRPLAERRQIKDHPRFRDKFVVGCVARNQPRKNLPALVKAFALVAERIEGIHLYLHTDPCDVGYDIVTLLRRYALEGRADVSTADCSVSAGLTDEQLNRLYNLFDLMALPTNGEGFGLPIIESLAAGVPVVATDYSACTELVAGRGELVKVLTTMTVGVNLIEHAIIDVEDLARCIEKLFHDRQLAENYGVAGRQFAKTLSWEQLLPEWMEVMSLAAGRQVGTACVQESRIQPECD